MGKRGYRPELRKLSELKRNETFRIEGPYV
jgi:hypothetical protein